ncbi:hypothetical protein RE432_00565 [Pusillimonas sp. SM2304]|uniref:hypothetical protein n=1 Tax=Pusillimonas sp. SM2304 TaxID=3073241 RepID=UPI002874A37C|nr:hypothetical protein [Pusillimonas sp. SM2304]MDS1138909.1 hypothetical protein [Pusillimonas sp. SM2304]
MTDKSVELTRVGTYRNARDLKRLYVLMHRYIRTEEDINRVGSGVYSPTLPLVAAKRRTAFGRKWPSFHPQKSRAAHLYIPSFMRTVA